jgi:hypothetical protein
MRVRFLGVVILLSTVACAGMRQGGGGAAVAVDDDGIPVNATPEERDRLLKNRVCTLEVPIGSHIPERVCRSTSNEAPAMPIEEMVRTQGAQMVTGK